MNMHAARRAKVKSFAMELDSRVIDLRLTLLHHRVSGLQRDTDVA